MKEKFTLICIDCGREFISDCSSEYFCPQCDYGYDAAHWYEQDKIEEQKKQEQFAELIANKIIKALKDKTI